ncbi:MAG: hypothetical protein ABI844_04720 [Saprospiraceae bacterium]
MEQLKQIPRLHQRLEIPLHQQMAAHELIAHLSQSELLTGTNERTAYYLKLAKLKLN